MKAQNLQTPKPITRLRSRQIQTEATPIAKHDKIVSRSLDADFTAESALNKRSDLITNQTKKHEKIDVRLSDSDFTAESEFLSSDLPDPVASPADSVVTQEEPAHHILESPFITDLLTPSQNPNKKESKYKTEINLIKKALEETNQSADISESSKKIIDAMFEAAVDQLKPKTGTKINRSVPVRKNGSVRIDKVCVGTFVLLVVLLMWLILVRLIGSWLMDDQDWPHGLPPT